MFKDIYIETERLIIKPYSMEDIDNLYKIYSDEKVMPYIPEGVMTYQWVKNLINWMVEYCYEKNTPENIIKFGVSVVDKEINKVIGWCGLGSLDCNKEDVEIFYGLSSEYWGQGLATEAVKAMLQYGFNIIGLKRIIAVVKPDNVASKKVIEKVGMKFEKILKVDDIHYSGYDGELYYALSKDEYEKHFEVNDIKYNIQLEKLCNDLQLGEIVGESKSISGGFLHRMYAVETTAGKYAVKALNPQIMLRTAAMQHFINSEKIVNVAANRMLAIPAKRFNDIFIYEIDKQFYLVFDWVEGKSLKLNEINIVHCEKIGAVLADIHLEDFSKLGIVNDWAENKELIDWNYYLEEGQKNNAEWIDLLKETIDNLYHWNADANKSAKLLAADMVISHRDLDPKNVLWNLDNPIVIDWESAGYINPMQDLVETAIYWADTEMANISEERFTAFIAAYKKKKGKIEGNWKAVLASGFLGKLGWLEYNLKRSLLIECTGVEEQQMGTLEVTATISAISRYADMIPKLKKWLNCES